MQHKVNEKFFLLLWVSNTHEISGFDTRTNVDLIFYVILIPLFPSVLMKGVIVCKSNIHHDLKHELSQVNDVVNKRIDKFYTRIKQYLLSKAKLSCDTFNNMLML